MDAQLNVRSVFAQLGIRLHYYESEKYLLKTNEHAEEAYRPDFYFMGMIEKIARNANDFDPIDVYTVAGEYIERIIKLLPKLKRTKKSSKDEPIPSGELWSDEFFEYMVHLSAIVDAREGITKTMKSEAQPQTQSTTFVLAENFKLKDFGSHFKQPYSHQVITLFMQYLIKIGVMPPYEQTEFSKLAPVFFGYHEKTIAKDIRNNVGNSPSKNELTKLKNLIDNLLLIVNEDLSKVRK